MEWNKSFFSTKEENYSKSGILLCEPLAHKQLMMNHYWCRTWNKRINHHVKVQFWMMNQHIPEIICIYIQFNKCYNYKSFWKILWIFFYTCETLFIRNIINSLCYKHHLKKKIKRLFWLQQFQFESPLNKILQYFLKVGGEKRHFQTPLSISLQL